MCLSEMKLIMFNQTKMQLWYPKQVVDARAGPGTKSMTKFKSKSKKLLENGEKKKKKHFEREYSPALSDKSDGVVAECEMAEVDFMSESGPSGRSSRTGSPGASDCEDHVAANGSSRRRKIQAKRRENLPEISSFIDMDYWQKYV